MEGEQPRGRPVLRTPQEMCNAVLALSPAEDIKKMQAQRNMMHAQQAAKRTSGDKGALTDLFSEQTPESEVSDWLPASTEMYHWASDEAGEVDIDAFIRVCVRSEIVPTRSAADISAESMDLWGQADPMEV